jgi:hypothetical protein
VLWRDQQAVDNPDGLISALAVVRRAG